VRLGYVSIDAAHGLYQVVIRPQPTADDPEAVALDAAATTRLRTPS